MTNNMDFDPDKGNVIEFSTEEDAQKAMTLLRHAKQGTGQFNDKIQRMADRLISTLDALMPPEEADVVVRDVATQLYNDVLQTPGKIVANIGGYIHGGFGKNGKKAAITVVNYSFKPEDEL